MAEVCALPIVACYIFIEYFITGENRTYSIDVIYKVVFCQDKQPVDSWMTSSSNTADNRRNYVSTMNDHSLMAGKHQSLYHVTSYLRLNFNLCIETKQANSLLHATDFHRILIASFYALNLRIMV